MKIHQLRNATLILEWDAYKVLVDPMLGNPESYTIPIVQQKNPIVPLPAMANDLLNKVTHAVITHLHKDHLDDTAIAFLKQKNIPVSCSIHDAPLLQAQGLHVANTVAYWQTKPFVAGSITGIPATHGYGTIVEAMGNVMGFVLQLPNHTVYLSSDTVYTNAVAKVLQTYTPDISVIAAGGATLGPDMDLLMHKEDILTFCKATQGKVIANHLEALTHCLFTRTEIKGLVQQNNLTEKVWVPEDGETLLF